MQLLSRKTTQWLHSNKSSCLGPEQISSYRKVQVTLAKTFLRDLSTCGFSETPFSLVNIQSWEDPATCGIEQTVKLTNTSRNSSMHQMTRDFGKNWDQVNTEEVLMFIEHMDEPPCVQDFIYIVQKCRKERRVSHLHAIHALLCKYGLENSDILGNVLVQLCLDCKRLEDSQRIFSKLIHPNEYTQTALMWNYNEIGDFENALNLFILRDSEFSYHSKCNCIAALKACAGKKHPTLVQHIHMEVVKEDLDKETSVINSLVGAYSKCGLLPEARKVFQSLSMPSPVVWNVLMAGYAEQGVDEEVLQSLNQMLLEGLCLNSFTVACALRFCAVVGALKTGKRIHCVIAVVDDFQKDTYVGNALVDMYVKFRNLNAAIKAFNVLRDRDVVTWTTLISGFTDCGLGQRAVDYLEQMQAAGVPMNAVTLASTIKAYVSMGLPEKGQVLHSKIVKEGLVPDQVVGNALIDMYAKFGLLLDAQEVFKCLPSRNSISWNILIAGCSEQGFDNLAMSILKRLILEGGCMDSATYISSLKSCSSLKDFNKGCLLHFIIVCQGHDVDSFIGNSLIDMYAKSHAFLEAIHVFANLRSRSIISWTACIAVYLDQGLANEALIALEKMQSELVSPDEVAHIYGLQACGIMGAVDRGQALHSQIVKQGFESALPVVNSMVHMYDKCYSLIDAYYLFLKFQSRTPATWSVLIAGYTENDLCGEALMLLDHMEQDGWPPNAAAFASSLRACGILGAAKKGFELHSEIVKKGIAPEVQHDCGNDAERAASVMSVGNALIDMYAKCKDLEGAKHVFSLMPKWNLETWNALMVGYTRIGEDLVVFHLFSMLIAEGILLNEVTFLILLTACSHAGFVKKGVICYVSMSTEFEVVATVEHHNCLIDLLGRAGQLSYAIKLLEEMPTQPNMSSWNTILAACRKWGNVELARRALECAMRLDENHAAAFIAMYNIYADANMWTDAKHIKSIHKRPTMR